MNMNAAAYDELALKRLIKEKFAINVTLQSIILPWSEVGRTAKAAVFLTEKKQLMAYIEASSALTLGDVKKLLSRMGLRANQFFPPHGQHQYFDEIARYKFKHVFPGRTNITDEDLMFYKTLAPYNPALALISEVKAGEIYQFDPDARGHWRVGARFHYRRIRTS